MIKNMKKMAVAATIVGLASMVIGVIAKLIVNANISGISPRGFGQFTVICFLLSINLLLLDKKT